MRFTKQISLLLLLIIIFSFVALVNVNNNVAPSYSTSYSSHLHIQEISFSNQGFHLLNQTTRLQIYNFIIGNPGTNFRGICNSLALPIGVVQYHLALLIKGGLVSTRRDGRNKRYFEPKKFSNLEIKIMSILRHDTARKILTILYNEKSATHGKLTQRLEISSQALTWQMKKLKESELITGHIEENTVRYALDKIHFDTVGQCIATVENGK
jgi:predicted transcriptional regulator